MFNNNITINEQQNVSLEEQFPKFDYNSFYRAIVMSIDDPERLGRIKVKIPALHHDTPTQNLPYAWPGIFAGFGNQMGQILLPPVGSIVYVAFEYSSEHRIIYFGGVPTLYEDGKKQYYGARINDGKDKLITEGDLPREYTGSQYIIYKSPSGAIVYIDDDDMRPRMVFKDSAGQTIIMSSNNIDSPDYGGIVTIRHNDDNLIRISDDGIILRVAGEDYTAPFGGGGSGSGTAKTVLWD